MVSSLQEKARRLCRRCVHIDEQSSPCLRKIMKRGEKSQNREREEIQVSNMAKDKDKNAVSGNVDGVRASKVRFPVYLYPETMKSVETLYKGDNCATKTEFIEKAIRFYCGFLYQNKPELVEYLAPQITEITDGIVRNSESRLSRAIFKLAVEIGMQSHVIAASNDVDLSTLHKLREMVIDDIRRTNGTLNFEKAVRFQKEDE